MAGRLLTFGGAILMLAIAGPGLALLADRNGNALPGAHHGALHLNCPPGSHGTPRYAKFGRSLGHEGDDAGLGGRSLTAVRTGGMDDRSRRGP